MKNVKIVRVAEWDGWCGACAAERPLVLTRTGRQRLRTWLTAAADDSRPLVLTCRLCGTGVDVPLERDDPPPAETPHELVEEQPTVPTVVVPAPPVPVVAAAPALPTPATDAELTGGRQAVASALGALLAQRSAAGGLLTPAAVPTAVVPAPAVPMQRTATTGGLAELHLLADGIDLLSTGRA